MYIVISLIIYHNLISTICHTDTSINLNKSEIFNDYNKVVIPEA